MSTTFTRQAMMAYAERSCASSPLYASLLAQIKTDPEMRALMDLVQDGQPVPITFLTCVNYLVFADRGHRFASYYPYLCSQPSNPAEAYPHFKDFCLRHFVELRRLVPHATLQTNEAARCAQLLPAFMEVYRRGGHRPLHLIELGSSAGLNLHWPHYYYQYSHHVQLGESRAPVEIHCTLEGEYTPPLLSEFPVIASIQGIELTPPDITTEEGIRWLQAAIWPEEVERYPRLQAAIQFARSLPPPLLVGDASDLLPHLLTTVPPEAVVCVWHSYALNQGPWQVKERIEQTLAHGSLGRAIYRVSLEVDLRRANRPVLELLVYQNGSLEERKLLAYCTLHGERMEWIAQEEAQ